MEKIEIKKIIKNEVSPYLIGLRNEVKQTNELLDILDGTLKDSLAEVYKQYAETFEVRGKEIEESNKKQIDIKIEIKGDEIEQRLTGNLVKVLREKLPKKGKDYFTQREIIDFKKAVTPKFGVDYKNGDDGKTPVKGKDYFTEKERAEFLKAVTPIKGIHYKDGAPGVPGKNGKNGTEISAEEIRNRLETLRGKNRLSISAIKDLEERLKRLEMGGGGSPTMTGASSGGGHIIQGNYVVVPNRGNLNFIGGYVSVIDDPTNDRTNVIISSGGSAAGNQGDFQWNNGGGFAGLVPAWTDGSKVFFGTNGGTDFTQFDEFGFQTMSGAAKVWKEVPCDLMPRDDARFHWEYNNCPVEYGFCDLNPIPYYLMPSDDTYALPFQWEVPHDYEQGTPLLAHVHFAMKPSSMIQNTGNVIFETRYAISNPQQDCTQRQKFKQGGFTMESCKDISDDPTEWMHFKTVYDTEKATIDGEGLLHSLIIRGVLFRSRRDEFEQNIIPLSIDFHYVSNKLGTPQPADGRICNI